MGAAVAVELSLLANQTFGKWCHLADGYCALLGLLAVRQRPQHDEHHRTHLIDVVDGDAVESDEGEQDRAVGKGHVEGRDHLTCDPHLVHGSRFVVDDLLESSGGLVGDTQRVDLEAQLRDLGDVVGEGDLALHRLLRSPLDRLSHRGEQESENDQGD